MKYVLKLGTGYVLVQTITTGFSVVPDWMAANILETLEEAQELAVRTGAEIYALEPVPVPKAKLLQEPASLRPIAGKEGPADG